MSTIFIIIVFLIITLLSNWKLYEKLKEPGWKGIVPIYNSYVLFEIINGNGLTFLITLIPIVGIIYQIYTLNKLSKSFGHGVGFTIGLVCLAPIFNLLLAFSQDEFQGINSNDNNGKKENTTLNLTKQEKAQIKKRNQKKDIILDLNNKYKDYETEAVFKFYDKFKDDEEKKRKDKNEIAKRNQKKKKEREKIFSIKALQTEINGYGFTYSIKDYSITLLFVLVALFGAGIFYSLKIPYLCAILLFAMVMMPGMITTQFRYIYEQQKFSDVVDYMEYMLYEFKKKPKILYALRAAEDSCTGDIKKRIKKAIDYIENGVYRNNLYKEAFYFIEEGYNCERVGVIHQFLMKIEAEGGEYQDALNIILDDVKSWTERTYEFQKEKANIKQKVMITIILSLIMCAILTKVSGQVYDITGNPLYQFVTTGLIIAFITLYAVVQKKLSGSWLVGDSIPRKKMFQQYALAVAGDVKTLRKKNFVNTIVFIACGVLLGFGGKVLPNIISPSYAIIGYLLIGFGLFSYFIKPSSDIKAAKKNTIKEINKEFPGWFRNLAINLQKETVTCFY